ncbi:sigma-54-dependent Fis family transcriptional regulator [Alteribacillus sp. JSM 102045]|uniref:sigma-54-dependent Fis family transcriptional regulator n=1 Tax=Alteribacillus sp. JSM 102045 TaxID=1562101 RepID=UPI0035C0EB6B
MNNSFFYQSNNQASEQVLNAWSDYITKGTINTNIVRSEVLKSWKRSKSHSVNPYQSKVDKVLSYNHLKSIRDENKFLLSVAEPNMKALAESLYGTDTVITLADRNGIILNTFGDGEILSKSEGIGLVPGSMWNEPVAGTNAVGIVLNSKKPIQVLYSEHFSKGWHDWSSTAAPIYNPLTNELIGVFDIAGKFKNVSRQTLELAILKTKLISNKIINQIYECDVNRNPYLSATLKTIDDAILIVDSKKNIVKKNHLMHSLLENENIDNLLNVKKINTLIDLIIERKEQLVESEVTLLKDHSHYLCKMMPIFVDMDISGVLIYLKKNDRRINDRVLQRSVSSTNTFNDIIGNSPVLKEQISLAKKAANIDATLFISGETGTGKEVFAQAIHNGSHRSEGSFVAVNCGAIPENLIESELFGYEAGAFTGAHAKGSKGKFEQAQGGTIFLDEVGDMPLRVQVQLLRVLEEKAVTRIGGQKPIALDIRVLTATHKNLQEEVERGNFRKDLYYRIQGIRISLPPLHKRGNDILQLARRFISELAPQFNKVNVKLSEEASLLLLKYKWPGNLRELKNILQQALFKLDDDVVLPQHLPEDLLTVSYVTTTEKDEIIESIKKVNGHMSHAATKLGISRATLYRKLKKYELSKQSILKNEKNS